MHLRVVLLALLLCGSAVAAPVPTHLIPPTPPIYYPTAVGTKLVYARNGVIETRVIKKVELKEGSRYITTVTRSDDGIERPFHLVRLNPTGVFILESSGLKHPAPFELIRTPFKAGIRWPEQKGTQGERKGLGEEVIKVAAGEFKCLKVETQSPGAVTTTHWYARGIGVVKVDYGGGSTLELQSFMRPGK